VLDCGLLEGGREFTDLNRDPFPFDPREVDAVLLSRSPGSRRKAPATRPSGGAPAPSVVRCPSRRSRSSCLLIPRICRWRSPHLPRQPARHLHHARVRASPRLLRRRRQGDLRRDAETLRRADRTRSRTSPPDSPSRGDEERLRAQALPGACGSAVSGGNGGRTDVERSFVDRNTFWVSVIAPLGQTSWQRPQKQHFPRSIWG